MSKKTIFLTIFSFGLFLKSIQGSQNETVKVNSTFSKIGYFLVDKNQLSEDYVYYDEKTLSFKENIVSLFPAIVFVGLLTFSLFIAKKKEKVNKIYSN